MKIFNEAEKEFIYELAEMLTGLQASQRKEIIINNVQKRMLSLGIMSIKKYLIYCLKHESEYSELLSAFSIHHTHWFREFETIEAIAASYQQQKFKGTLNVLVTASSTGEEVWCIVCMLEIAKAAGHVSDYTILATDVDPISVQKSSQGIYSLEGVEKIPDRYRHIFNIYADRIEIPPKLKVRVKFRPLNLLNDKLFPVEEKFDLIFCRNVLYYFDKPTIDSILKKLSAHIHEKGMLALSLSDHFTYEDATLVKNSSAVWRKTTVQPVEEFKNEPVRKPMVMIVDDSQTILEVCKKKFSDHFQVQVFCSPLTALEWLNSNKPDLVISDLNMPEMHGREFISAYRARGGRSPVMIMSDASKDEAQEVLAALDLRGDQVFMEKSKLFQSSSEMIGLINGLTSTQRERSAKPSALIMSSEPPKFVPEVILFGSSTGGTEALHRILEGVGHDNFPPIVVVQHIAENFLASFAQRLSRFTGMKLADWKEGYFPLKPGYVYLPVEQKHMVFSKRGKEIIVQLAPPSSYASLHCPAVDVAFKSFAKLNTANLKAWSFILTGMGSDGAAGMLELKNSGVWTVGQSAESCVVYGMPKAAMDLKALKAQLSPLQMREHLLKLSKEIKRQVA
jgi:two-component system chemotaxis response regulator CheB